MFHPHLTKIVATISDQDGSVEFIDSLYERGMDVVRLNTAHASLDKLQGIVENVRKVSPYLAIMLDTKGPNIRTLGLPEQGLQLVPGTTVRVSGKEGSDGRICVNYPPFAEEVPVGSRIVCDDSAVEMKVVGKEADCLVCMPVFECTLFNRKSVNVPDVSLKAPSLSGKDKQFLAEAVRTGCDFIAHSFVRNAQDVKDVRKELGEAGKMIRIIAKIENREGVNNIEEILDEADGIMVARGDLGIEIPLEEVPAIQKKLIFEARKKAKPVITATQMLQSMTKSPVPTRAEVSDVANAVYDGTDAVMLSGETAHGQYPREAVATMRRIVLEAEKAPRDFFTMIQASDTEVNPASFLLAAAVKATDTLPIKAIVVNTLSGSSARLCASLRPYVHIFAPTPNDIVRRQLALSYGVLSELVPFSTSTDDQIHNTVSCIIRGKEFLQDTDLLILLGKLSDKQSQNNIMGITTFKSIEENHQSRA